MLTPCRSSPSSKRILEQQTARIAVIGQIKAGKSSFINAFTRLPDLLPTDINPWTSVVTLLNFRDDRPPPEHAAVFQLFSPDEWQRIANGQGRLRELTERLVPGFEPELLRAQLEVMRQRAQNRLGPKINELLGQTHRYNVVTPELLDNYVSAGTYLPAASEGSGRLPLSDITRTAELYFPGGTFAFPTTIIDTPGINDPFLVRDEITRQSLGSSDVYVFVISALQPLTATDLSLLRILNGLSKDRIVVYINRIDQLPNPQTDARAITAAVRQRLQREFPSLEITVIAGSAWWGGLALTAEQRDVGRLLPPSSIAYLRDVGLPETIEMNPSHSLSSLMNTDRKQIAAALHLASGMPAVGNAISALLAGSSGAVVLRQIASCFLELAKSIEISSRMELQSVLGLLETRRAESHNLGERIRQERVVMHTLDEPIRQIQQSLDVIERQLAEIVRVDVEYLHSSLNMIVESTAQHECQNLLAAIRRREHEGPWHANLAPLRETLERCFVASLPSDRGAHHRNRARALPATPLDHGRPSFRAAPTVWRWTMLPIPILIPRSHR